MNAIPRAVIGRSYGFFAVPFGVSGSYSTANLQAELESGTLANGAVSVVDAAASNGNAAEVLSGNATGAAIIGATWTPPAGTYTYAIRYRNSGAPSNATEMRGGLDIGGVFNDEITFGSATGSVPTYLWAVKTGITLNGSQTLAFHLTDSGFSTTVNWFFDEAALLPASLSTLFTAPQNLWQQFLADRTVRMVRL